MNVFLCDDQPVFMEEFSAQLKEYFKKRQIPLKLSAFTSGRELLEAEAVPDILFLDIRMDGMSGLETARILRKRSAQMKLIFLTAYKQYVFLAFDVDASHYLIKPVKEEKLEAVLNHVIGQLSLAAPRFLTLQSGSSTLRLPCRDILYLEVRDRKVFVHTLEKTQAFYGKLDALEGKLPEVFYRCHRSFIVNMEAVVRLDKTDLFLRNGEAVPVSKRKYHDFSLAFMNFLQKEGLS